MNCQSVLKGCYAGTFGFDSPVPQLLPRVTNTEMISHKLSSHKRDRTTRRYSGGMIAILQSRIYSSCFQPFQITSRYTKEVLREEQQGSTVHWSSRSRYEILTCWRDTCRALHSPGSKTSCRDFRHTESTKVASWWYVVVLGHAFCG